MSRKPPARGAREGVKADIAASRDGEAGFAAGQGTTAWTHDFLNKKPWHPLNFRNQMKRFEAEEELIRRQKLEEANKAEFDAEQNYLETLAHLPGKDADKYRDMQGVSWMYIKPPGMKGLEDQDKQKETDTTGGDNDTPGNKVPGAAKGRTAPGQSDTRNDGRQKERGVGTAIGHRLKVKRRPQSPPIGGLQHGTAYEFVTEDEPEVDERLLQALQAAAGEAGTSSEAAHETHAGNSRHRKRQREEEHGMGSEYHQPDDRERVRHRDEESRGDGVYGASKVSRREKQYSPGCRANDEHQLSRHTHSLNEEYEYDGDRQGRRREQSPDRWGATVQYDRGNSTGHDRKIGEPGRRDEIRHRGHSEERCGGSGSDRERWDREGSYRREKGKGKSHKEKKSKKRSKEKNDDATLEDAVRFIVEQGLSAEEVLREVRGRRK